MKQCEDCEVSIEGTVDHILPISRGGHNSIENCVPACLSCNSSKGNKTADEYKAWKAARSGLASGTRVRSHRYRILADGRGVTSGPTIGKY